MIDYTVHRRDGTAGRMRYCEECRTIHVREYEKRAELAEERKEGEDV
jgi:hypothetical protein